jgi:hypothetical protein
LIELIFKIQWSSVVLILNRLHGSLVAERLDQCY